LRETTYIFHGNENTPIDAKCQALSPLYICIYYVNLKDILLRLLWRNTHLWPMTY
jgi:hypothetical protein